MAGKIEGRRRRGWQRMKWLDGITNSMDMFWASSGSWWWTGKPGVLQSMGLQRVRHDWATELNWSHDSGNYRYAGGLLRCTRIISTRGIGSILNLRLPSSWITWEYKQGLDLNEILDLLLIWTVEAQEMNWKNETVWLWLYSNPVKQTFLLYKNSLKQYLEVYIYLQFHVKFSFRVSFIKY